MTDISFWPGSVARVRVQFTGETGAAIAVSNVQVKVRSPAGTVTQVSPSNVVKEGVGRYYVDVSLPKAGVWAVRATCDSPQAAAEEVAFSVMPSLVL